VLVGGYIVYKFIMVTLLFCSIATPALAGVVLDHGFVRAMPPGQKITAAYMSLTNTDAQDAVVSAVSSDMAARVEIHESYIRDGMMAMRPLTVITVPAQGRLEFAPGGAHLMLFGIERQLKEGDQVNISLQYNNGVSQQFLLPVKRQQMTSNHHMHH
jgi:periplasmic copper chaperone A